MEVLPYLAVSVAAVWLVGSVLSRTRRNVVYDQVADKLGITSTGGELAGEILGYKVGLRTIHREIAPETYGESTVLTLNLWTVPPDLVVERSQEKLHGHHEGQDEPTLGVGRFDSVFVIRCNDADAARDWLRLREQALSELHRISDFLQLERGALTVELSTDADEVETIEVLLRWGAEVAARLDTPTADELPSPPVTLRGRSLRFPRFPREKQVEAPRGKMRSVFETATLVTSLGVVLIVGALFTFGALLVAWDWLAPGPKEPDDVLFAECAAPRIGTMQDDWTACEEFTPSFGLEAARKAYFGMRQTQARYDARVNLDPDGAREALVALTADLAPPMYELAPLFWTYGLVDDYRRFMPETPYHRSDHVFPALQVLDSERYVNSDLRQDFLYLYDCLVDNPASAPPNTDSDVRALCDERGRGSLRPSVAELEVMTDAQVRASRETLEPDAALLRYVIEVTATEPVAPVAPGLPPLPTEPVDDPVELAARLKPLTCASPWLPEETMGEPARLLAAAAMTEPLADRLRLLAARQYASFGEKDAALAALAEITEQPVALCAAQLETALGEPAAALERLATLTEKYDGHVALAASQAHLLQRSWKLAHRRALEAMSLLPSRAEDRSRRQTHATLVAVAAASQLNIPDGLDEYFGEVGEVKLLGSDPLFVTRWFGAAARSSESLEAARWIAPEVLPMQPGAEPVQLLVAGALVEENVEYWLDILWPVQFDPFGYTVGRRIAAQMRGDAKAAAQWQQREEGQLLPVETARDARLHRLLRAHD